MNPVTGWTTAAGVVSHQSARTTNRVTTACAATTPLRFTKNMYIQGDALQVLSFQIKKRLPIGRGGAILTDSRVAYEWLKLATYDGRNLDTPYDQDDHVQSLGWHFYMTPEDAARGIWLMDRIPEDNPDMMDFQHYPDLRLMKFFSKEQ